MDMFKRVFLAGVGALNLSRERAKAIVDELVKSGEVREKEGRILVNEMMKKAADVKDEVEATISKQMDSAYKRLNLASVDQLKKMERRIQELEKELQKAGRAVRPAKASAAAGKKTAPRAAGR